MVLHCVALRCIVYFIVLLCIMLCYVTVCHAALYCMNVRYHLPTSPQLQIAFLCAQGHHLVDLPHCRQVAAHEAGEHYITHGFIIWVKYFILGCQFQHIFRDVRNCLRAFQPSGGRNRILLEKLCIQIGSRPQFSHFVLRKCKPKNEAILGHTALHHITLHYIT